MLAVLPRTAQWVVGASSLARRALTTMSTTITKQRSDAVAKYEAMSKEQLVEILVKQNGSVRTGDRTPADVTVACVGLVGPGLVGKALLEQFRQNLSTLKAERQIDVRVCAIANSKKMLLSDSAIDLDTWEKAFETNAENPSDLNKLKDHLVSCSSPVPVIIDCSASDFVSDYYKSWMESGVHVVTPNKKVNSGPLERYKAVKNLQEKKHVHYFYEATVGAGLPVIATIKHLVDTGDKIKSIEGIFSGTLSYIFNNFKDGKKFSDIVIEAQANGFTEPDPRDDLSGMDVARKVTTLARESGLGLELDDVPVESLVPEELQSCSSSEEYLEKLPDFDEQMAKLQSEAEEAGEVLRYVGSVDVASGKGSVKLKRYPASHPFAQLNGTDNIILCVTDRYDPQPLVITGPGAGAEVTAGGVFSDLIRLCAHFGAPS
mmetsp:Transcript_12447/g.23420  ORF Transcript_12447/g.23420 Transcript_12447/m.23420 type:complete len:432 (+) Transcript_12447:38-1333(+)